MDVSRRGQAARRAALQAMRIKDHGQHRNQGDDGNGNHPRPGGNPDRWWERGCGGRLGSDRWGLRICLRGWDLASRQVVVWQFLERTHITIAQPPASLDKLGALRLTQGFAYAADGFAEALVVDVFAVPKPLQQFLAGDHAVAVFEQAQKYLVGFALQGNAAGTDGQQLLIRIEGCGPEYKHNDTTVFFRGRTAVYRLSLSDFTINSELGGNRVKILPSECPTVLPHGE